MLKAGPLWSSTTLREWLGDGVSEKSSDEISQEYYAEIVGHRRELREVAESLEREPDHIVAGVVRRLAGSNRSDKAPAIQAILDRRLHDLQIASQAALRETMENVSRTLLQVEANQKSLELANLQLAMSSNRLATSSNRLSATQVALAVVFGLTGIVGSCGLWEHHSQRDGFSADRVFDEPKAPEPAERVIERPAAGGESGELGQLPLTDRVGVGADQRLENSPHGAVDDNPNARVHVGGGEGSGGSDGSGAPVVGENDEPRARVVEDPGAPKPSERVVEGAAVD